MPEENKSPGMIQSEQEETPKVFNLDAEEAEKSEIKTVEQTQPTIKPAAESETTPVPKAEETEAKSEAPTAEAKTVPKAAPEKKATGENLAQSVKTATEKAPSEKVEAEKSPVKPSKLPIIIIASLIGIVLIAIGVVVYFGWFAKGGFTEEVKIFDREVFEEQMEEDQIKEEIIESEEAAASEEDTDREPVQPSKPKVRTSR